MTPLTRPTPPTTATPAQRARKRRSFDAVVASYIRELATAADPKPGPRAVREPQGC
jgi:hypothetical protein